MWVRDGIDYGRPSRGRAPLVEFRALSEAWELVQARWGTWILATLLVILGNGAVAGFAFTLLRLGGAPKFQGFRWSVPDGLAALQLVVGAVINGFFLGGMFRMACKQVRGEKPRVEDLFQVFDVIGELALGSALYAAAVAVASLFCFVPALIVHGLLMFTLPLIVDGRMTAPAAVAASWHALKGQWPMATVFHLVVSFFSGIGVCCFGVGLLLTAPLYVLSVAVLYRDFFLVNSTFGKVKPIAPDGDF